MAVYDDGHIGGQRLTPDEIGEAIRHKKYGVDVREAIAQGFEYFQGMYTRLDQLEGEVSDLQQTVGQLQEGVGKLQADVIASRSNIHNLQIDNQDLQKRISKLEKAIFEGEYINDTDDVVSDQNATESVNINDTHPVDDDNGIILEDDSPTIPSDVN